MAAGVRCLVAAQSHTRARESNSARRRLNVFPLPERRFPGSIQDECTRDAGNRQSRVLIDAMVCRRVLGTLGVESVIGGLVCGVYSVVAASLGVLLYYVPTPPAASLHRLCLPRTHYCLQPLIAGQPWWNCMLCVVCK